MVLAADVAYCPALARGVTRLLGRLARAGRGVRGVVLQAERSAETVAALEGGLAEEEASGSLRVLGPGDAGRDGWAAGATDAALAPGGRGDAAPALVAGFAHGAGVLAERGLTHAAVKVYLVEGGG